MIWLRQLLLTLIVRIPHFLHRQDLTTGNAVRGSAALHEPIRWVQAGLALLLLLVFWLWHACTRPFQFAFQNLLEHFLFFCALLLVILAGAYTFPEEPSFVVEVALTSVLILSVAAVGVAILVNYVRYRIEKLGLKPNSRARVDIASGDIDLVMLEDGRDDHIALDLWAAHQAPPRPEGLPDRVALDLGAAHQAPPNRTRRWAHAMMESASRVSDPAVTKQALDFAKRTHAGNPNNTLPFVGGTFVTYGLVQWDSSGTDSAAVFT